MSAYSEDPSAYFWKMGGITYEYVELSSFDASLSSGGGSNSLGQDLGFFNNSLEGKESLSIIDKTIDYARDLGQFNMDVDQATWVGTNDPKNPGIYQIYNESYGIPEPIGVEGNFSITYAENVPRLRDEAISETINAIYSNIDALEIQRAYIVYDEANDDTTTRYKIQGEWFTAPTLQEIDGLIIGYTFVAKLIAQKPESLFSGKTADDVVNFANINYRQSNNVEVQFTSKIWDMLQSSDPVIENIARELQNNSTERRGIYLPEEGGFFSDPRRRPGGG